MKKDKLNAMVKEIIISIIGNTILILGVLITLYSIIGSGK